MQIDSVAVITANQGGALQVSWHGLGANDIDGIRLKRRIKERVRARILVRRLDRSEAWQAIITSDAVTALMERLEEVVERDAPAVVAGFAVLEERLEALVLEVVAHQARLRQADDTTRRLDTRDGVQALAHPERAIRTMADRVHELVGVTDAKPRHQDLGLVRFAVAIGIGQFDQSIEIADEDRRVTNVIGERLNALNHRQAFSEANGLIGLAIAIGIFETEDVVAWLHAGHRLRVGRRTADIQTSLGVPGHLRGLGDTKGLVGEQIDLETLSDLKSGLLFGGSHDLLGANGWTGLRCRCGRWLTAGKSLDVLIP